MNEEFLLGIKFFSKKEHKEMFDSGHLYTRHISFYREQENNLGTGRGDANEGILEYEFATDGMLLQTEQGHTIRPIGNASVSMEMLDDQHIFSFMIADKDWYVVGEAGITLKLPEENSKYFLNHFGKYYSVFDAGKLIAALNNTVIADDSLAYCTHFKVNYVDDEYLRSRQHFDKINELIDRIEKCRDNYEAGKPLLDELYKEYMGIKSKSHFLENEMRIVLGIFSKEAHDLDLHRRDY